MKPGGGSKTVSRCDIQQVCSAGRPASRRPGSRTVSSERPNSPTSAPSTRPPSVEREQLHAVTDAQHRDAELEQRGSSFGAPSAYTEAGPPERIRPRGLRRAISSTPT